MNENLIISGERPLSTLKIEPDFKREERYRPKSTKKARLIQCCFNFLKAAVFILSVFFTTLIFASTVLILYAFTFRLEKRSFLHFVGVIWAKSILALNLSWNFRLIGKENIPTSKNPVVYVSNHVSQTDILAIFSIGSDFRWLSKESVFRIPFLGWAMTAVGYVPVIRGNKCSHKRAMDMSKAHLKRGTSMVFFPEGTRSPDGRIRKFKPGAFLLAYEAGVPVVPIILTGTERLLPKGSFVPGHAHVTVTVHPPIHRLDGEDVQEFMDRVFSIFQTYLPDHMKYQPG